MARRLGLNGVPSIVLDGQYLFSGAQPNPRSSRRYARRALRSESLRLHGSSSSEVGHDVISAESRWKESPLLAVRSAVFGRSGLDTAASTAGLRA